VASETRYWLGSNLAATVRFVDRVTEQGAVPTHAMAHPEKTDVASDTAMSVTFVPPGRSSVQPLATPPFTVQDSGRGDPAPSTAATVPPPVPCGLTVSR